MQIIQDQSQHLRLSQRATSCIFAVLHPPLSKIPDTRNLMQGSIRDFFIFNVKNMPQNKTIIVVCCKKNNENQGNSVDRKRYAMGKKVYINA